MVFLVVMVNPGALSTTLNCTLAPAGITASGSSSDVSDSGELVVCAGWSGGNLHLMKSETRLLVFLPTIGVHLLSFSKIKLKVTP